MTKTILRRLHRDEVVIPVAKATAAPHLSSRQDRDRVIGFDDFDPEADFTGMPHDWTPARGADELDHDATVSALTQLRHEDIAWLPASVGLRVVPLPAVDPLEQLFAMLDEAKHAKRTDWLGAYSDRVGLGLVRLDHIKVTVQRETNTSDGLLATQNRVVINTQRALNDDIDMVALDAIRVRQTFAPLVELLAEVTA